MKNIFCYWRKAKKPCIAFLILSLVSTLLSIVEPKVTANMVTALTQQKLNTMAVFAIIVAVVAVIRAILKYVVRNTTVNIRAIIGKSLEEDLCRQALNIKSCFLPDFKSGELTEITKSNPGTFLAMLQQAVMMLFGICAELAIAIYVAVLSWQSFLLYLVFLLFIVSIQKFSLKKEKENAAKGQKTNDTAKSLINQIYHGISEIKIFNLKNSILDRYSTLLDEEIESAKEKEQAKSANRLFSNISYEIFALGFILLGIVLMKNNLLELSAFITIFMYKGALYCLIFDISELRSVFSDMKVLAERMNKVLLIEPFKLENFGHVNGGNASEHSISIKNVSFSYEDGKNILDDVSFKIKQGQFIGLVGESGSAKTTLIKLISRQLEPTLGEIEVDDIYISEYSEKGFTNLVSLASQEPFVFSFSIRENLLMVRPEATETQLWKALEDAQILDFVRNLPHSIDTVLKETINVSGGQKQRLALARLFLKDTPIVLMDEATSALDNRTQAEITALIQQKAKQDGKIFICIAHRIEAVESADTILFMKDGKIADVGTHKKLLSNPDYQRLLNKE